MKIIFIASVLLGASFSSNANFVHSDYLVEGDKEASLDTNTGLEWLKLDNITGLSLNEVTQMISKNGSLRGWRLPSEDEVATLMSELYRDDNRNNGPIFIAGRTRIERDIISNGDWFTFLGTNSSVGTYTTTYGLISAPSDGKVLSSGYETNHRYYYGSDLMFSASKSYTPEQNVGLYSSYFLVSDGGVTLSSKNNPEINQNNPNAPINDVPVSMFFSGLFFGLCLLKRKSL